MKSGYDQFFKKAQQAVEENGPLPPRRLKSPKEASRPQQRGIPLAEFEKMTAKKERSQASSNTVLANQLREQAKQRLKARRKKKPFPVKMVGTITVGLVLAGLGCGKAE